MVLLPGLFEVGHTEQKAQLKVRSARADTLARQFSHPNIHLLIQLYAIVNAHSGVHVLRPPTKLPRAGGIEAENCDCIKHGCHVHKCELR